jgi:uncharacterized coiled-coil protein SlyX
MKKLILKWLGLDKNINDVYTKLEQKFDMTNERIDNYNYLLRETSKSLDNRRNEINGIIETLQNLDNHEVISDLHKRIQNLEIKAYRH